VTRRYDRTGEQVEDDVEDGADPTPTTPHDPMCRDGWLGETPDGRLVPCDACRPWIKERRQRLARVLAGRPR
jgi:hypothetical protein